MTVRNHGLPTGGSSGSPEPATTDRIRFTAQVDGIRTARTDGGGYKVTLMVAEDDARAIVRLMADYYEKVYVVAMTEITPAS